MHAFYHDVRECRMKRRFLCFELYNWPVLQMTMALMIDSSARLSDSEVIISSNVSALGFVLKLLCFIFYNVNTSYVPISEYPWGRSDKPLTSTVFSISAFHQERLAGRIRPTTRNDTSRVVLSARPTCGGASSENSYSNTKWFFKSFMSNFLEYFKNMLCSF